MGQKIERDHQRFRKIVRGKVKSNLSKYISRGELIGKKGKDLFMPLRLAITGQDHGPELVRLIPLLQHASEVDSRVLSPLARVEKTMASSGTP